MTRACGTCEWWVAHQGGFGECRGGTPSYDASATYAGTARFPTIHESQWCAVYRRRESLAGGKDVRPKGATDG